MRPLLPKNLIFLASSYLQTRALLQVFHFSASPNYPYSRRHDDESRNTKVSVWWDFENCHVPASINVCKIGPAIMEAVRANGIKGPLQITAFGDVLQLSRSNQEALAYTGIHFTHIPNGGKNSADRSLLVDLMYYWISQNPPPAHFFLISGDKDFAGILHRLRMNNYNILLAIPGKAPDVLCSAATIIWQWSSLIKEEDLTGKHVNHPPDGPLGSWYGNYKVPLENPFSTVEQSASSQTVEIYEPTSDSNVGVIPKSVTRQVRHILSSHPKGISIIDLRAELAKCDVRLDKNLYGYKRFSRFLLSMPNIQLRPLGDGNFCVRLTPSKSSSESPEPSESIDLPSTTSAIKNEERETNADGTHTIASSNEGRMDDDTKSFQQVPSQGKPIREHVDDKSSFPPFVERQAGQAPNELQKSSLGNEKFVGVADTQLSEIQLPLKDNELPKTKTGSLKKRLRQLPDNGVRSEDVSCKILEEHTSENHSTGNDYTIVENNVIVNDESKKSKVEDKYEKPTKKESDEVCRSSYSSPIDDSVVDIRPGGSAETYSKKPTFFSWIRSWWPFSKSSGKSDDLTAQVISQTACHSEESKLSELDKTVSHSKEPKLSKLEHTVSLSEEAKLSELDQTVSHSEEPKSSELDQNVSHSGKPQFFYSDSFWSDVESFVLSPKGSLLFSQSRSREDMAHKLQKDGPVFLRSLTEKDILQLVDLLIAEKKWLEESPSQLFPFKLTQSVQRSSLMGQSHGATGLRSLFVSRTSQSSLQNPLEHNVEKENQSAPHTGVSIPFTELKFTERSKNDALLDCQKLVKQILREHPEGYNIGSFRKLFFDTYGYHLDIHKLGYTKLASLLRIMPRAKLESTYIFPAVCASDREVPILKTRVTNASHAVSNSDCELSDSAPKDDDTDSPWEELGPVSINNSNHSDLESKLNQKDKELYISKHPDYEPIVSDDDSSESEGDSSSSTQPEKQGKRKCSVQDSSFWQALDSWHNSKEGENNGVKKLDNVESLGNSLVDILNSSTESTRGTLSKIPSVNLREKHRSQKYSFVADPVLPNDKDKLIDEILDGFRNAKESKMQS